MWVTPAITTSHFCIGHAATDAHSDGHTQARHAASEAYSDGHTQPHSATHIHLLLARHKLCSAVPLCPAYAPQPVPTPEEQGAEHTLL